MRRWILGASVLLCAVASAMPSAASGSDRLYWANNNSTSIAFAGLDGSAGGDFLTTATGPAGEAIDSATGRLYFTNEGANSISFVNLDGSGGGKLNTGTATVEAPDGLAIDPTTRKIYWANDTIPGAVSFASLDGGGGADLNTSGATVEGPSGVTVDLPSGRLYWASYNAPSISFANLDDSGGGGDLPTAGATLAAPAGVAIDPGTRTIYWADAGNEIPFARLDGSGGGDLSTAGATVSGPWGVAIDPEAGRAYWANNPGGSLASARLDGGGGSQFPTPGATVSGPAFPILLKAPIGAGPPVITGSSTLGSTLTCSTGSWAPDLFGALLYRAPISFAFQWSLDGKAIPGATSASVTVSAAGQYTCRVTGSNPAGASAQASAPHAVGGTPVPPDFDTAILEGKFLYLRLKCPSRFKPECVGKASAVAVKDRCTFSHGRRHCKRGTAITSSVPAKQKPRKWKVATLEVKPSYAAKVAEMAKRPDKKLLIVRQLVHAKRFKKGRPQSVYHLYRVRTATK